MLKETETHANIWSMSCTDFNVTSHSQQIPPTASEVSHKPLERHHDWCVGAFVISHPRFCLIYVCLYSAPTKQAQIKAWCLDIIHDVWVKSVGQNDGLLYSVTSTELKFRCLKTTCHTHHYLMQRDEEMTPSASRPSFYLLFEGSKTHVFLVRWCYNLCSRRKWLDWSSSARLCEEPSFHTDKSYTQRKKQTSQLSCNVITRVCAEMTLS